MSVALGTAALVFARARRRVKRILDQKSRLEESLLLVQEVSAEMAGIMDLERLLPYAAEAFLKVGRARACCIMLIDEDTGQLGVRITAYHGQANGDRVDAGTVLEIAARVSQSGESLLLKEISGVAAAEDFPAARAQSGVSEGPVLFLPLSFRTRILGVAYLDSLGDDRLFDSGDRLRLSFLAGGLATAISQARLHDLVISDSLTKLGSPKYFLLRLEQKLNHARKFNFVHSLVLFRVDHFKDFQSLYGRVRADEALVHAARVLIDCIREVDVCARMDREEFAVLLAETGPSDALFVAERFRRKVESEPVRVNGQEVKISISLGLATLKGGEHLAGRELVDRAGQALHAAQTRGGNCTVTWEEVLFAALQSNPVP